MKKVILAILVSGFVTCGLFTQATQAVPINGAITFAGGCELDTGTVNTATTVTGWLDQGGMMPHVQSSSGDLSGAGPLAVFTAPWTFISGAHPALWTVVAGGITFTFNLSASHVVSQGGGFVNVAGTGILTASSGFDPTAFTWSFSAQDPPAGTPIPLVFSFSASGQTIPDGGATVALLGLALAGIEGIRRKLKRANS
jgi:hypothetical protein